MINDSTYLLNGPPQNCALCHAPFIVENEYVKFWRGKDWRYCCCSEHADFGWSRCLRLLSNPWEGKYHEALRSLGRKVRPRCTPQMEVAPLHARLQKFSRTPATRR